VAHIARKRPVKAVMVGARIPAGNTHVDGLVAAAGLVDIIEVRGELPRSEVLALMARSRVLVHPSRFESQGYVFLEALMQGASIVSFPVGIAEASDRWRVVEDLPAMIIAAAELLERGGANEPRITFTMDGTVDAYENLFSIP